ncbi:hypothetical protein M514_08239 [Trichuris suis]|uniref:Uncharacterized protein n=1 Tax=Trichuris suis TaxID=68888 RepID=A0A085M130_9BILA|nr:hypothetical protein M513_08239 [Trichuris suis]KFD65313.1 hypothetical protein M514_08239 [Trichuris suis]
MLQTSKRITCSRPVSKTDKYAYNAMIMHFDGFQKDAQYSMEIFVLSALLVVTSAVAVTVACVKLREEWQRIAGQHQRDAQSVQTRSNTSSKTVPSMEEKTVESQDDSFNLKFAGSGVHVFYPPLSSRRPSPWRLQHTLHKPPRLVDVTMKLKRKEREETTDSSMEQNKSSEQRSELHSGQLLRDQKSVSVSFDDESVEDV